MGKFRVKAAIAAMAAASLVMTVSPAQAEVSTGVAEAPTYSPYPPAKPANVQRMIDDMVKPNDGARPYYGRYDRGWAQASRVVMGTDARGTGTPDYWSCCVVGQEYADGDYWTGMNPWVMVHTMPDNRATNTRVQLSAIRAYILSKESNKWSLVQTRTITGSRYDTNPGHVDDHANVRYSNGYALLKPEPYEPHERKLMFHGWGEPMHLERPGDIKAVHIAVWARLVKDDPNGPDDRHLARYTLQVGGDYYPYKDANLESNPRLRMKNGGKWFPGIGNGRAAYVGNSFRLTSFTTLSDLKPEHWDGPRGMQSKSGGITIQELRDNPPPA